MLLLAVWMRKWSEPILRMQERVGINPSNIPEHMLFSLVVLQGVVYHLHLVRELRFGNLEEECLLLVELLLRFLSLIRFVFAVDKNVLGGEENGNGERKYYHVVPNGFGNRQRL